MMLVVQFPYAVRFATVTTPEYLAYFSRFASGFSIGRIVLRLLDVYRRGAGGMHFMIRAGFHS